MNQRHQRHGKTNRRSYLGKLGFASPRHACFLFEIILALLSWSMSSLSSSYSSSVSCTSITNLRHRRNPSGIILPLRSVLLNTNLRVEILRLEIWIQHIQKNGHLYFLWSSLLGIRSAEHRFTFSSHREYVNRESIVIAKMKRSLSIWWTQKKKMSVCLSVCG